MTDADTRGMDRINVDASVASSETATAALADNVSITTDANKRVLFVIGVRIFQRVWEFAELVQRGFPLGNISLSEHASEINTSVVRSAVVL